MEKIISQTGEVYRPRRSLVGYLPLVAALLLLAALVLSARAPTFRLICFICALLLAALAIGCSAITGIWARHCATMAAVCALAIVGGIASADRLDGGYAYTGLALQRITNFRGLVIADAQAGSYGRNIFMLQLQEVAGTGLRSSSAGTVLCTIQEDSGHAPPIWGEYLSIGGQLQPHGSGGIAYRCSVAEIAQRRWRNELFRLRAALRARLLERIAQLPPDAAGLFRALFVGQREGLDSEELLLFRRAGAMHVLALSGMHLGIIATLLFIGVRPLIGRRWALIVTMLCCGFYVLLVGLRPSLLRALVMFCIWAWTSLRGRRSDPLNVLALTFILLVLAKPAYLHSLSFELSFVALAGILIFAGPIAAALTPWLPSTVRLPLAASIGALLASAPSLMLRFGVLYPVGLLSGMLLAPLATIFIWGGLLFMLLAGLISTPLATIMQWFSSVIVGSARLASWAPALLLNTPRRLRIGLLIWGIVAVASLLIAHRSFRSTKIDA